MGSVTEQMTCPHCNTEDGAMVDFNYKSGEECIHCLHCGYHRRFYITNFDQKDNENWTPEYEIFECKEPLGAFDVRYKEGFGECGTLHEEGNEDELMAEIEKYRDEIESATISKLVDGQIVVKQLI